MKNKIFFNFAVIFLWCLTSLNSNSVEQFNFNVTEVEILENGNKYKGLKRGIITTNDGVIITADTFEYDKPLNILNAKGNVKIEDTIEDYIIYAQDITYLRNEEKIYTRDQSKAIDKKRQIITADTFEYDKLLNILNAKGNVKIEDTIEDYIIYAQDITYLRNEEKIYTLGKTTADIKSTYNIKSKNVTFLVNVRKLSSKDKTTIKDKNSQIYYLDEFKYLINKNLLKGKNILSITNFGLPKSDKFYFSDAIINLEEKSFIGKDTKVEMHKDVFGELENDPRLLGVSSKGNNEITIVKKGIFTSCKKNDDCPPWSIKADEIKHDKVKRQLIYENAIINVYNLPVFYMPKFFHPDPTVKRQSGLLKPEINHSNILGSSLTVPYYFNISDDKDFTSRPTWFDNKFFISQNEFRQAKENSHLLADFGYVRDYKSTTSKLKKKEKKNFGHLFANLDVNLSLEDFITSKLLVNIEKVTNDSYLKVFDAHLTKSPARPDNSRVLNNKLELTLNHDDYNFQSGFQTYESLGTKKSDRYQYILPYYSFDRMIAQDFMSGSISFNSNGNNDLKNTNILTSSITNDFAYNSQDFISTIGLKKNFNMHLKNFNSIGRNSTKYKSSPQIELINLFNADISFPLIKEENDYTNLLIPKLSFFMNPSDMKNHSSGNSKMNVGNLFDVNRLGLGDSFESGRSLTLGIDYRKENKVNLDDINKYFELKLATVLRDKEEGFIPKKSTLNRKTSNIFGSVTNRLNDILTLDYNFAIDNDFSTVEYNNFNATISVNNLVTSFTFFEENGEMGDANSIENTISYNVDSKNYISFNTRRNRKINLTEYYNLVYEYKNDCLTAGVKYKKTFYQDSDIKPEENLLFTITLFPLTSYEYRADDLLDTHILGHEL